MRVLLDTHFLIWAAIAPNKINGREQAIMTRNDLLASAISILEMRIKWHKFGGNRRRRTDLLDPGIALVHIADNGIELAPLTGADCAATLDLAILHRDPFDEMLLIHAQRLDAKLLTRDGDLQDHPLVVQL